MKITIAGDAFVITSDIKKKDFDLLKKYKPEVLTITDEEGNDVFSVDYAEGRPSIAKFGITFSGVTRNNTAKLTLTSAIPQGIADAKEYVADTIGSVMANIKVIEDRVSTGATEVANERKALIDSITVA